MIIVIISINDKITNFIDYSMKFESTVMATLELNMYIVICMLSRLVFLVPVKCRPILHHLFFWSSGIMDCLLFTFENRVALMC